MIIQITSVFICHLSLIFDLGLSDYCKLENFPKSNQSKIMLTESWCLIFADSFFYVTMHSYQTEASLTQAAAT